VTNVALEQIRTEPGDVQRNLARVVDRAVARLGAGADIVVFPELAVSGYTTDPDVVARVAEPVDGPTVAALRQAVDGGDGLVVAGFCERDWDRVFNTVVMVGRSGVVLHYRKLHPFDRERLVFTPGDLGLPVVDTQFGRLGVCVCYDLRFVEVLRLLALRDTDIVLAPAAWVGGFDAAVPRTGLSRQAEGVVAQANLDQVAVVAVSQVGSAGPTAPSMLGGSLAVDAYGQVVAGPLSRAEEDTATAAIDVEAGRLARVRGELIQPRAERRLDVYSVGYGGRTW
jgi:predicted amidohydrolase